MKVIKNYTITKETEKAVYVSIPYWIPTGRNKRSHIVKKHECWIPKSLTVNNEIPEWVVLKSIEEIERRNPYKHITNISDTQKYRREHLGQVAPKKVKINEIVVDEAKLGELRDAITKKYNAKSFRDLLHNGATELTDEDDELISLYSKTPNIEDLRIPHKTISHHL